MKFNAFAQNFVFNLMICFKDTESVIHMSTLNAF